jgi:hypothetical protein
MINEYRAMVRLGGDIPSVPFHQLRHVGSNMGLRNERPESTCIHSRQTPPPPPPPPKEISTFARKIVLIKLWRANTQQGRIWLGTKAFYQLASIRDSNAGKESTCLGSLYWHELMKTGLLSVSTSSLYYEELNKEEKLTDRIMRRQILGRQRKPAIGAETILQTASEPDNSILQIQSFP